MKTLVRVNPATEFRAMDEMFDRLFGRAPISSPHATHMPIDIYERDGKFVVKAAVPGIDPADLDVQIENNILTIRGEVNAGFEDENTKVYRREVAYGSFARSIRLPDQLKLDDVDAEFNHGFVTISIPKTEEEKAKALKVNVRSANGSAPEQKAISNKSENKS
jgi:HSP20 family protein